MKKFSITSIPRLPVVTSLPFNMVYSLYLGITFIIDSKEIKIPIGFTTDGASIPRLFWFTTGTPFSPHYIRGAILHDYLYQTGVAGKAGRKWADEIFYSCILADGASKYNSIKIYLALRLAGWIVWNRYRRLEKKSYKAKYSHITLQERESITPPKVRKCNVKK